MKMAPDDFLPFALPDIGQEEIEAVTDTLRSGWLTTGPKTARFESDFAKAVGAKYALAVNSATAGLHLALEALGVQSNEVVLTTPWTFTATAEVIRYLRAHPIFADVDPVTLNVDADALENKINECRRANQSIRAILPVHFAGQACRMQQIMELAEKYDLRVVEDAAHAYPTTAMMRSDDAMLVPSNIGTIGDVTVFSFYVTKPIATGEGGMITTENEELARRIKLMRLHGISRDVWDRNVSDKPSWYYEVVEAGFKYNMTDIAAAIGIQQLKKAHRFHARRSVIAATYTDAFSDLSQVVCPKLINPAETHSWHLYTLRLNLNALKINRDRFIEEMIHRGVGCSVHFIPLHLQPYWRDLYQLKADMFPVATNEYERVVSLPIYPRMDDQAVAKVIDGVRDIVTRWKR